MSNDNEQQWLVLQGGCHCGAVRYEIKTLENAVVQDCNCSICSKSGFLHLILPASRFKLLSGDDALISYTFSQGAAQHLFCKTCGIKSYYIPRSNPDGFSVNVRCLDKVDLSMFTIEAFDGINWEDNADSLAHLSK